MRRYRYLVFSGLCEILTGILPIVAIPVFISRIGAHAYADSLFPMTVVSLLVAILDFGINLNGLAGLESKKNDRSKIIYIISTVALKVIVGAVVVVVCALFLGEKILSGYWLGAILLYIAYSLYPSWLFVVVNKVMVGQVINSVGRALPIIILLIIIAKGSKGEEINVVMGSISLAATCVAYKLCLSKFNIGSVNKEYLYKMVPMQLIALIRQNKKFWITQILQSSYRSVLPVLAGGILSSIDFLAYSISDKLMRAFQTVLAYYFQSEFGKVEKKNNKLTKIMVKKFIKELMPVLVILAVCFYVLFLLLVPYISSGNDGLINEINGLDWILPLIAIVGGANYWFGSLALPLLKKPISLVIASGAAGLISLILAYWLGSLYGAWAVMVSMLIGEMIFFTIVINEYKTKISR